MASKKVVAPEKIVITLNLAMSKSNALDGDCRECQVHHISRLTDEAAKQLGRNWNVDLVNGECQGECTKVLEQLARSIGADFEAAWS